MLNFRNQAAEDTHEAFTLIVLTRKLINANNKYYFNVDSIYIDGTGHGTKILSHGQLFHFTLIKMSVGRLLQYDGGKFLLSSKTSKLLPSDKIANDNNDTCFISCNLHCYIFIAGYSDILSSLSYAHCHCVRLTPR